MLVLVGVTAIRQEIGKYQITRGSKNGKELKIQSAKINEDNIEKIQVKNKTASTIIPIVIPVLILVYLYNEIFGEELLAGR